jgi:hypothetical protein
MSRKRHTDQPGVVDALRDTRTIDILSVEMPFCAGGLERYRVPEAGATPIIALARTPVMFRNAYDAPAGT